MSEAVRIPLLVADQWEWQRDGACRGMSAAVFFSADAERGPSKRAREARARAVCSTCPVLTECQAWALAVREPDGVWGGTSPAEREELLSRHRGDVVAATTTR